MRRIAICAALAACGPPELGPEPHARAVAPASVPTGNAPTLGNAPAPATGNAPAPATGHAPTSRGIASDDDTPPADGRLSDAVAPVTYALTLEVDPASATFAGHVEIALTAAPGTRRIWLHAAELELRDAAIVVDGRREPVAILDGHGPLVGFALPRPITGGATLAIDYTGHTLDLSPGKPGDEEGLFRERVRGRWYLFSQAESSFARRIVPCFDEPRFKSAWRVTAVVPRGMIALANAPLRDQYARPDGRREVRFAEIAALPSYLLALAVGPFDLVDAGTVGRGRVPVRLAVAAGDARRARVRELPKIVDALERYLDAPLPLAKLDLVAVPEFFGAMENPGLITVEDVVLVGGRERTAVLAHELAHQWFGNSVTPAWWDRLWLSEAFATWLAAKIVDELGARRPPIFAHRARADALAADAAPDARPLIHPVAADNPEPAFDALAYEKGAAVLAMFERIAGPAAFQAAVRRYLARHAGHAVTSQAFLDAFAAATRPELATALASNLTHAGTPVVTLRCASADRAPPTVDHAPARIIAEVADGVTVPVCIRFPVAGADERRCFLAGAHAELAVPACPAWLVGNDGGRGYYRLAPTTPAPLAQLSPDELLAHGDDIIGALGAGELTILDAVAAALRLAATRDHRAGFAAIAITRAIAAALIAPAIQHASWPWTPPR